jgi:hypothetical protein
MGFAASIADSIDDAEHLPATAMETAFIERIIAEIDSSVPPIDGWVRDVKASVTGNAVRDDEPLLIYERAREVPLYVAVRLDFRSITREDERNATAQKSAEELQQELMAAAMSGDAKKTEALQQELAAMMQAQMEAGPMGQAVGVTPVKQEEKPLQFYVAVIVNGDGETIGKKYDITAPGVVKAFRNDNPDRNEVSYKYYIGDWAVSELDKRNWRIVSPAEAQNAANHLRAVTAAVTVSGDKASVESYINDSLSLNGLNRMVD